ncbi:MAG: DNA polymerase IV [Actinomycetota bacterium]
MPRAAICGHDRRDLLQPPVRLPRIRPRRSITHGATLECAPFVLHVDIDEFIAAVEVLRRPELRGRPVVVGGDGNPTKRGVVSTASYEARRFGIRSGMPLRTAARRCPEAVFLPVDREAYQTASKQVMETLRAFDGVLEVAGWDEAFVEVDSNRPEGVAEEIRRRVHSQTGLSCSVGIGDNKLRAKIASGLAKPGGVFRLTRANWPEVMRARPTDSLWGVGKKSARRLSELGIESVGDLADGDETLLANSFGPATGPWLMQIALGEHFGRVSAEPYVAKSHGKEVTFQEDVGNREVIQAEIAKLARAVADEIEGEDRLAKGVTVKVRFAPFDTHARSVRPDAPARDHDSLVRAALRALDRFDIDRPVRLLGVRANLVPPAGASRTLRE